METRPVLPRPVQRGFDCIILHTLEAGAREEVEQVSDSLALALERCERELRLETLGAKSLLHLPRRIPGVLAASATGNEQANDNKRAAPTNEHD